MQYSVGVYLLCYRTSSSQPTATEQVLVYDNQCVSQRKYYQRGTIRICYFMKKIK